MQGSGGKNKVIIFVVMTSSAVHHSGCAGCARLLAIVGNFTLGLFVCIFLITHAICTTRYVHANLYHHIWWRAIRAILTVPSQTLQYKFARKRVRELAHTSILDLMAFFHVNHARNLVLYKFLAHKQAMITVIITAPPPQANAL